MKLRTCHQSGEMPDVRLLPDISYGTKGYPEEIARRLRVLNIAAWMAAVLTAGFAASFFASGSPEMSLRSGSPMPWSLSSWPPSLCLHRFNALVGPLTFGVIANGGRKQTFNIIDLVFDGTLGSPHSFLMFLFRVSHPRTGDALSLRRADGQVSARIV